MKDYMKCRIEEESKFIIKTQSTIRMTAKVFGVSKSTVYTDISERLLSISPDMHEQVAKVISENKAERHMRGGVATKRKYAERVGVDEKII